MAYIESLPTRSVAAMMANLAACRMSGRGDFSRVVREVLHEPEALKETIKLTDEAAAILLEADDRGDPQVFGGQYGPIDFNQVIENYWGRPQKQEIYTQ